MAETGFHMSTTITLYNIHQGPKVTKTKTLERGNSVNIFIANKKYYIHTFKCTKCAYFCMCRPQCSGEGWEGPLFDVCGALWVPLQRLHHLAMFQHQPHQLILALNFTRARVHGTHQLQLQKMLKRLKHTHAQHITNITDMRTRVSTRKNIHLKM